MYFPAESQAYFFFLLLGNAIDWYLYLGTTLVSLNFGIAAHLA